MKRRIASLLLCATMVTSMLVGCGSKTESTQDGSTTTTEKTSEDSSDSASNDNNQTQYTKSDGKIVYWSMWDTGSNQANAIEEIVAEYEKKSGNEVDLQFKGRDIRTLIGSAIQSGQQIDLYEDDFEILTQVNSEYALDLDEMAKAAGYYEKSSPALSNGTKDRAGFLACLPYQPYVSGFFYDRAMFEKAGITQEPKTWSEFLEVCQKLKDSGVNPVTLDDAYVHLNFGIHLAKYIGQEKVQELSLNGGWADEPAVKKAAQDMVDLYEKGYLSPYAPAAFPQGENEIGYGESAMVFMASWLPDEIKNNTGTDVDWGMFSYPGVDGGIDGPEAMMIGAQGISVSKQSKNQQAAFELAMEIVTGEGDVKLSKATNSVPADPNNTEWPEVLKNCKPAFDQSTKAYSWAAYIDKNADFKPGLVEACSKLFQGKLTADDFVKELDKINPKK